MKSAIKHRITGVLFAAMLLSGACTTVDVFEKNISIPGQRWEYSFKPTISFNVSDTVSSYNIYVVLRHTNYYQYTNIWLNIAYQMPNDSLRNQKINIQLASNDKGWFGKGMDDIFEMRKLITPQPYTFRGKGKCTFTISQIMRDNPLLHIMNAGIRVEKVH